MSTVPLAIQMQNEGQTQQMMMGLNPSVPMPTMPAEASRMQAQVPPYQPYTAATPPPTTSQSGNTQLPPTNPMAGMAPGLQGLGSAAGFAIAGPVGGIAGGVTGMAADYLLGSFERRKQERELKKEIARREAEARRLEAKQDGENAYNRMRQQGMDERSIEQTAFQNAMQKVQDQRASQDRLRRSFTEARNFRQGQQAQFVQQGYL